MTEPLSIFKAERTEELVFAPSEVIGRGLGLAAVLGIMRGHKGSFSVLLDLSMPGMSGEATFQSLKEINRGVQVILSSGYSEAEATREFIGQGLVGFIQKPYDISTFVQRVRRWLEPH